LWNYIRTTYPEIGLYAADQSHPSQAGSYAAACSFYTVIFREDPVNITFNYNLDPIVAQQIRDAAKVVVYDELLEWNVGSYDVTADFEYTITEEANNTFTIDFVNNSTNVQTQWWDFGEASDDQEVFAPSINVEGTTFQVTLTNISGCDTVTHSEVIVLGPITVGEFTLEKVALYPIPATKVLNFKTVKSLHDPIIKIFSINGKLLFKQRFEVQGSTQFQVDVSSFTAGVYLFEILEHDEVISQGEFMKN